MTGSLQTKNGKFYAVINLYDNNGNRKPKWVSTGFTIKGNKTKAEAFLRDVIRSYELKQNIISSDVLFSDWVRHWLEETKIRIDLVTYQGYEAAAMAHILPYFDKSRVKLADVTRSDLQGYINTKFESGRIDGKGGLSPKTLRLHKIVIQQALKFAVRENYILVNPCDLISLPPLQRFEYSFYTAEQISKLFDLIKDEPLFPLIMTTVFYGLRRSEVLGLKWDSVNFEANTLTIKHTVSKGTKTVEKDKTKNSSSYRSFPLLPEIREHFLKAKEEETENQKLFGREYHKNDYIFKWANGVPYNPEFVTHKFIKILEKYNLPHIRFHELRHSCASFLIAMGFTLKDVQEWLGHADIKMTANIYSHLDTHRKNNIADAFTKNFSNPPDKR